MTRRFLLPGLAWLLTAAAPPVSFTPVAPAFAPASDEYRRVWETEGPAIVAAMERVSGQSFPPGAIDILVSDGRPMASFDGRTIRLRASYSPAYKKATLVHELGHRLAFAFPNRGGLDDHRLLYLFLYDVWTDLYGSEFADRMARIEQRIGPAYEEAWTWALAMTREERRARLAALRVDAASLEEGSREVLRQAQPERAGSAHPTVRPEPVEGHSFLRTKLRLSRPPARPLRAAAPG